MRKSLPKKLIVFILIFGVFIGLFLANVNQAKASGILEILKNSLCIGCFGLPGKVTGILLGPMIKDILGGIAYLIWEGTAGFLGICANLFTNILEFTSDLLSKAPIYDGWVITRDIVNMFFILGLIVIAFATILRIESYGMKKLLPKLIIIALLINFSYLACGIIIDASNIVSNSFITAIKDLRKAGDQNLGVGGQIQSAMIDLPGQNENESTSLAKSVQSGDVGMILDALGQALVMLIAACILLLGAILLVIRMAALWILVLIVPFAWFLGIFPKFQSLNEKWWSNFIKYAFFTPIYVFFIFLGLKLVTEQLKIDPINTGAPQDFREGIAGLATYVVTIIVFGGAPMVAMSMGIHGSKAIFGFAKGALMGAVKATGRGLKMTAVAPPGWMKVVPGLRQLAAFSAKVSPYFMREYWKKATEARMGERLREAQIPRKIGNMQDFMNRVFSLGTQKTSHAEEAEQFEVAEKKKEIEAGTKRVGGRLIARLQDALNRKDIVAYKACVELLQEQGDTNDAMISDLGLFDNMKFDDKYALDKLKGQNVNDEKDRRFSNLGFKHGVIQQMRQMGLSEKQIAPFLGKLQEIGLQSGYFGLYGMTKTDDKGNMIIASDEEQIKVATAKVKTQTARMRTSKMHGSSVGMQGVDKNGQYEFKGNDDVADAILGTFTLADVDKTNMEYVRPDTQTLIYQAYDRKALEKISPTANALGEKIYKAVRGETEKPKGEKKGEKKEKITGETVEKKRKEYENM